MNTLYSHVRAAVAGVPWLVYPQVMGVIVEALARRIEGQRLSETEIAERIAAAERRAGPRKAGGGRKARIGLVPVYGVLAHRAEFFADTSSSGTSVQSIRQAFQAHLADPEIDGILFDVDSPGGQAAGIPELAEEIRAARGQKPMMAISNTFDASAALWISTQVDEFVVTPSSLTGSLGVVMAHVDETGLDEKMGIKTTLVFAGKHKVEMYPETPLSDDAHEHMQSMVDDMYIMFVDAVAAGRGLSVEKVQADFGQGRVLTPRKAVAAGMADRIDTFDGALERLATGKVEMRGASARTAQATRQFNVQVDLSGVTLNMPEQELADRAAEAVAEQLVVATSPADMEPAPEGAAAEVDGELEVARARADADRRRRVASAV